ncbi:nuclear transport factor 2 family protein [Spirillospora sp. CA-253888]
MTDENRGVALEYLKRLDTGGDFLELFAPGAAVFFPKWGEARGIEEVRRLFGDVGAMLAGIRHDFDGITAVEQGDRVVLEGTSSGELATGERWSDGRWCDVFEIRDGLIHRLAIYLDPDYAAADTARYPWL